MAKNDLFTTDIPTSRNPGPRVGESRRMPLAPAPTPAASSGAVPPQNLEAEESVLGAMMISPGAIAAVSEILDAGDFYREPHAKIYRAALQLYGKNEPVDAITLTNELEQRGELEEIGSRERLHQRARLRPDPRRRPKRATRLGGRGRADGPRRARRAARLRARRAQNAGRARPLQGRA